MSEPSAAETVSKTALNTLLLNTTGQAAQTFLRSEQGESTVVHWVTLQNGDDVVVRVKKRGVNSFANEVRAMQLCRGAGVPVPEVYGVKHLDTAEALEALVMAVARGRSLATLIPDLSESQKFEVFREVGKALRKIHTVELTGFGWLGEHGNEGVSDWPSYAASLLKARHDDVPMLGRAGLSTAEIAGLLAMIAAFKDLPYKTSVLCHGDLSTDHLFFDETLNLVDVIDFGMAQGGRPALDIGVFLMFHSDVKLEWLAEGYGAPLTDKSFERELLLHQTNVAISYLAEALRRDDEGFKDIAVMGLRGWLEHWRSL